MEVPGTRLIIRGLVLLLLIFAFVHLPGDSGREESFSAATIGDPKTLQSAYSRWKQAYGRVAGEAKLLLALGYSRGLSAAVTRAIGRATLDLREGSLAVEVGGLPADEQFDVWLVSSRPRPGRSVRPEPGDAMVRVGRLSHSGSAATLETRLPRSLLGEFRLDLVVVARGDGSPINAGLLFGTLSLFQRLYHQEHSVQATSGLSTPFSALVPKPAFASSSVPLEQLVAQGERIFFNETFAGNGRTCGTCHPAENNFMIDPQFIATRPHNDPLFVAEFKPDLANNFEDPTLMRTRGLILENVDGFDDLANKFVMRAVPHLLGLSRSINPPLGTTTPPMQRTGWGGDGAPGTGTLREFAIGAVTQHFTRTLNRVPEVDFRLPTDFELDALEAFQLSLGNPKEQDLANMTLLDAAAENGRRLFLTQAKCNQCHANAGANAAFAPKSNFNFNTGVEAFTDTLPRPAGMPRDGGFGKSPGNLTDGFGDGTFNPPQIVDAADTAPFFHNNVAATIEDAIRFYNSPQFNASPSGGAVRGINLDTAQVTAVAAFLRVLNTLENIRSSIAFDERALLSTMFGDAQKLLRLSLADLADAITVLQAAGLHPTAVTALMQAENLIGQAAGTRNPVARKSLVQQAIVHQESARADMLGP